ncbi:PREDICTED: facilitated trehalose transporter Tret1-like [Amphimedon queenslandica]|nr:PREDICTED: facilitated trehalose transporter Tret1-like [Amphimedon queenslandica]|eukprot:XP_011402949.1 PREDICTED: facilitated trehalose transporter Tret1-like [Amphimedon queenslandica]
MAGEEGEFWEKDRLLSESICSTYSETETSDNFSGRVKTNSDQSSDETSPSMSILQQTAPFLLLGTDSQTPSPMQSWHSVLAELKGPRRIWTVTLFSFLAAFSAILSGYTLAFPSSALLDLRNMTNTSRFVKGSSIEDYFGAMAPIGAIFGAAIAGFLSDVFGRKLTLILTGLPHVIGWLFLAGSYDLQSLRPVFILFLLIGRFLSGLGMGWAMLIAPIYIAEISVPVMRGFYSALPQLALSLGIPLAYCFGYSLMYHQSSLIAVGIAIFCSLVAIFIPESPRYLLSKGRREKACRVLTVLRGKKKSVLSKEIFELDNLVYKQRRLRCNEWLSELKQRQVFIPLILCLFVLIFQQLSGINALFFYGAPILQEAGVAKSEFMALLAIGLTEFVTTLLTVFIVDLFGRKYMLMLSSFIMMCSCTGLSTHLYLKDSGSDGSPLAILSVIMLIVGFSLGLGAIPWTLMTELLSLRVRGFLGGVLSAVNWAFAAIVTGLYLEFASKSSESFAWWMFAGVNLVAFTFVAFFLPETKGKKLEFIEQQMKNNFKLCV